MEGNKYEFRDDYVIGFTSKSHNEFYFDTDDFELVKNMYWTLDSNRNVICKTKNGNISMHKLLMGDGVYIHKNGLRNDNRRNNLAIAKGYRNDGRIKYNGYIAVYMPEHDRAFKNWCVYEHILVAEKMLQRNLLPSECVHHIDRDKTNNNEDNLIVFATIGDHTSFHDGAEIALLENGSYVAVNADKKERNTCPVCGAYKTSRAKLCLECANKKKATNIPSKDELMELIGKVSFVKIGEMYGVSDNAVRRWCIKYDLPFRVKDLNKVV